ncbi:MAG: hypothetical protein ACIALR_00200 [Blastopirellula sp. JB062]
MRRYLPTLLLLCFSLVAAQAAEFENLGMPIKSTSVPIRAVTSDSDGTVRAWGTVSGDKVRQLLGFDLATGKTTKVDLLPYRASNIHFVPAQNGDLYIYAGIPGRFLRYSPATGKLTDLGVPNAQTRYWIGGEHCVGPDDVYYVGTYPEARLVGVNMRTDETIDLGRLPEDDRELYIIRPAVSDDNIVYAPVGLHHRELWSVDPKTKEKRQILPSNLQKGYGAPIVWTAVDGQVYGRLGGVQFLCRPDGIELDQTAAPRKYRNRTQAGDVQVQNVDQQGRLVLQANDGQTRYVPTDFEGIGETIFSLGDVADGWLFGSAIKPGKSFAVNLQTGETRDLGIITHGTIQVYDFLHHDQGLFAASYTGGFIDLLNVDDALQGRRGKSLIKLSSQHDQERPTQLQYGPDDAIYAVTTPVKGHLGGALARIDADKLTAKVWRSLVAEQSLASLVPVEATGELFLTTDVRGGTGAKPSATSGYVLLWDPKTEKVVFKTQPIPTAKHYGTAVAAPNGLIYGIAQKQYYAFDPIKRQTVHVADLPTGRVRFPGLHTQAIGPDGLIYGIAGGAIIAIDPRDHSASVIAKHKSLRSGHGLFVTDDKVLYYGSGANLMRYQLP